MLANRPGKRIRGFSTSFFLFLILTVVPVVKSPDAGAAGAPLPLNLLRITPSGEDAQPGRQVVFEFNRPVVPLGRMERDASEIPVTFEPALACQWRWLNPSSLACQLDEKNALAPATRYRLIVRPGIRAEDGATLSGELHHTFVTQRPKVVEARFKNWLSPGTPRIFLRFSQPVQEETAAAHLYFRLEGNPRVAAVLSEDPDYTQSADYIKGSAWLVTPAGELPADKGVDFAVEPGIVPVRGSEPGVERKSIFSFHTFPEFRFLGVRCSNRAGKEILIRPGEALSPKSRCSPVRDISLLFSAPALTEDMKDSLRFSPPLPRLGEDFDPWETTGSYSRLFEAHSKGYAYPVFLPFQGLRANTEYRIQADSATVKDEFGRPLTRPMDIRISTDHLPPDYSLYKSMPVLEKGLDTDAPMLVTNIQRVDIRYEAMTLDGKTLPRTVTLPVSAPQDSTSVLPLGIRRLLPRSSGVILGEVATQPAVSGRSDFENWFIAQVTPFHVHVKFGHHNTLVWLTDLQTGEPVPGVDVQIFQGGMKSLDPSPRVLSRGRTREDGTAVLAGTETIDPDLKMLHAFEPGEPRLFLSCMRGEDMAFMPLVYDFRVDALGANQEYIPSWQKSRHGHVKAWGATAQGVYRAGDTVQYKIYVRSQDNRHFVPAPASKYLLKVMDPMEKVVFEREGITLSEFGAFDGEFTVPKNGAVGWYRFVLSADFTREEWEPLRVLVSDFTPSPFRVTTDLNGKLFGTGDTLKVITHAGLHAGGPYASADAGVAVFVESAPFVPEEPWLRSFQFDVLGTSEHDTPESQTLFRTEGKLDDRGSLESVFTLAESPVLYGRLTVESTVRDDRGKSVAGRVSALYFGRDRYVGILQPGWVLEAGKPARAEILVLDQHGKAAAGTDVEVKVERQITRASRVKGAGDIYLTQYVQEWAETESFKLSSGKDPREITFTPSHPGSCRIRALIVDTLGRPHETVLERWVTGKGHVVWESVSGNLLNVFPEKSEYKVGETARFVVQNPFPGAKALISVERLGVIQSFVKTFYESTEVVEVPVVPDCLPGFYFSAMVMSPRVEKALGPGGEDLGKPTFRMGYCRVKVKDTFKEIIVEGRPGKEVYKPGETASVALDAKLRHPVPGANQPPIELAVAVLDEAVFDLLRRGRESFDPYQGFYDLDELDLANFNLLMHLVGREKLEKKGANPGGAGGFDLGMRSLFKFVAYWNPSIRVDSEGKAEIRFQVPDNLTGWRVLAMAVTPEDRMGLGETGFKVNLPTEIRPALPNQVTEGDSFEAGFTVMNRTGAARDIDVTVQVDGPVEKLPAGKAPALKQQFRAEPFKRQTVRLPVKTTAPGEITFTVQAGDAVDRDALRQSIEVLRRSSPETAAVYGSTAEGKTSEPVVFPMNMRPGSGRLDVMVSPSVIGGLEGVFQYMRDYPYICWEQKLTVGVMAAFFNKLKPYISDSFEWKESEGLPAATAALAGDYQAPGGGMTFYVPKDENVCPYLSAFTALAFNWLRHEGYPVPKQVEARLHEYLLSMLRRDEAAPHYSRSMSATVRAVALAALSEGGKIGRTELDRFWNQVPEMSLFGKALYLQALLQVPETRARQRELIERILSHADRGSGTLVFRESLDSGFEALLSSSIRDNAAVLSALTAFETSYPSDPILGDLPVSLMRTMALSRKNRPRWGSTQENLFAVKSLVDFGKAFEEQKPDMTVSVRLDSRVLGETRFADAAERPVVFSHVAGPDDAGRRAGLNIEMSGKGRVYSVTNLSYEPDRMQTSPVNAGIEVHREYSVEREGAWVLLADPAEVKSGELVRVDLYVSLPARRYFVVVEDPVPGGLEPVSRDLATASLVDASAGEVRYPEGSFKRRFADWMNYGSSRWSFYHRELRHNVVRFYSENLQAGRYHLSYVAQAVAPGVFLAMPPRAEQMYSPDVYGKGSPAIWQVRLSE
jgi:hypothetical protein